MIPNPVFYFISGLVLFFHSFLNLHLCSVLSERTRFHKVSIFIVCLLNALLAPQFFRIAFPFPAMGYLVPLVVLVTEFVVLFKGDFSGKVGVALGSLLHLFVLRAISISIFSLHTGLSMQDIYFSFEYFPWVNFSSFAAQLITLFLFITLIPLKTVEKIMSNKGFYKPLLLLTSLLVAYMAYNSGLFLVDYFSITLAVQEIVLVILVLSFFYIMIFLLIRIFNLGIYKEKTKELEVEVDKGRTLASVAFNYAAIIFEVNCTKNKIMRILVDSKEVPVKQSETISDFLKRQSDVFVHPEDISTLISFNAETLIFDFTNGISEREYEYRSKKLTLNDAEDAAVSLDDSYYWYKIRISTSQNKETSDIISLFAIEEIHDEKEEALALRHRAECDPLTGAFNKATFETKVNAHLQNGGEGVLYMFDLDNFKGINDNMGHSAGDAVLREVFAKISDVFRARDLIGRIGGDEFVVFLPAKTKTEILLNKAQEICTTIKKKYHAENKMSIEISSSVGIAIAPKHGQSFKSLFDAADLAMYSSKSKGKDTFTMYEESESEGFKPQSKEDYTRQR